MEKAGILKSIASQYEGYGHWALSVRVELAEDGAVTLHGNEMSRHCGYLNIVLPTIVDESPQQFAVRAYDALHWELRQRADIWEGCLNDATEKYVEALTLKKYLTLNR